MNNNPFHTQTFRENWCKHFNNKIPEKKFSFIKGVHFIKKKIFPVYVNIGLNLTSGITYDLEDEIYCDYQNKIFLIRDIPSFYNLSIPNEKSSLRLKKLFQYQGFVTEIEKFDNLQDYMKSKFRSNSRYKFRRNIERLEKCFDVTYKMFYGYISQKEYDFIFEKFYDLLEKRYAYKREYCGELQSQLWEYYSDLAYKMILEKTASIFVIYSGKNPIGITFSYHNNSILITALTVFDVDYSKFNIGHILTYKLLEWSFNNGVTLFDYTHGNFEYKRRWSNNTYKKKHHLLYDSSNIYCRIIVFIIDYYFKLKRVLRENNLIYYYHKLRYTFGHNNSFKTLKYENYHIEIFKQEIELNNNFKRIDIFEQKFMSLRKSLFDYYYKNPEEIGAIKFYRSHKSKSLHLAIGTKSVLKIIKI